MDLKQPLTALEVAAMIGAKALGRTDRLVTGINEINRVREGDLLFVDHPKYYTKALNSAMASTLNAGVRCQKMPTLATGNP
jgi:UDP-3-O-[3-hydroxymyristoyl] glucosamine N-acyltransferase